MKKLLAILCLAPAFASAAPDIFGAIAGNDISMLKAFVAEDPASATNAAKKGMTPLHYASSLNRQEAAYLLLKAGVIFGARHMSGAQDGCFVSCVTVPRFSYEFYRILSREEIQQKYPEAMPFFNL